MQLFNSNIVNTRNKDTIQQRDLFIPIFREDVTTPEPIRSGQLYSGGTPTTNNRVIKSEPVTFAFSRTG